MSDIRILLVEDNPEIGPFLQMELEAEGYAVTLAEDGFQGLSAFRQDTFDLVLLDWEMPRMSGIDVCKRIRKSSQVPIIVLTAKGQLDDKITGLDAGANDYIVKPFELDEVLARVRVQLRSLAQDKAQDMIAFGPLKWELDTQDIYFKGELMELSPREHKVLTYFLENPRQVLSKTQIFEKVWGWDADNADNSVEVCVSALRRQLELDSYPRMIHTKRGLGYILKEPV